MMISKSSVSAKKNEVFQFEGKLWRSGSSGGWCFVTIPKTTGKKIRTIYQTSEEGWGRLKAIATIGRSTWTTAIWFDTKAGSYLLPVKAVIRNKEKLALGARVKGKLNFNIRSAV